MAIEEVVDVSVDGIGEIGDLATGLDKAADAAGRLKDELASLGAGGIGSPDALAASWDAALNGIGDRIGALKDELATLGAGAAGDAGAAEIGSAWDKAAGDVAAAKDKILADGAELGDAGAAGAEGAAQVGTAWDDAAADVSAAKDKIVADAGEVGDAGAEAAAGLGKLGDALEGVGDKGATLAPAADGIKGLGASADESAAQFAALRAEIAATGTEAEGFAASAASGMTLASAKMSATYAEALPSLGTASIEQDASVAQAQQARKIASQQAKQDAAAAEESAGKYHMLALGAAGALAYGLYQDAKLQTGANRLYTSAGEKLSNLPADEAAILAMSGQTDTSQAQLLQGAYWDNSAGFHGKAGMQVLKAGAEGAYAEGAPLADVSNAETSLMNAYGYKPSQAMSVVDMMLTAVGRGKMTMAGLSSALPQVLPVASAAHISAPQVLGALSTMTGMGMSPDQGAQNLRHTIGSLQNMTSVQTGEIQQLGGNPVELEKNLGKTGLLGTLEQVNDLVGKSMGKSGLVMISTFNRSASAAQDANRMISAMPASIQKTAQAYADGSLSAKQWQQEVYSGSESAGQKNLLEQFATVENKAKGFSDLIKGGSPADQTYAAALSKALGGGTGLNTFLELMGSHLPAAKANIDAVAEASKHAGDNVQGWSKVQQSLNYQLGSFTKTSEAVATQAGQIALPAVTSLMHGLGDVTGFLASHPDVTKPLLEAGGLLAGVTVASKVASAGTTALASVGKIAETLNIPGLSKLSGIGQDSGAATMSTAAGTNDVAAGKMQDAAATFSVAVDKMGTISDENVAASATGGAGAGAEGVVPVAAESAGATEEDAVVSGSVMGDVLKTGLGGVMATALTAAITIPLAQKLQQAEQQHLGSGAASGLAQVGTGAAAGAATGAVAGSVIPGLGTAVGAIAGALIGGVTAAVTDHKAWNDLSRPAIPATGPTYAPPKQQPWQPEPSGHDMPLPVPHSAHKAQPATAWHDAAHIGDDARHIGSGVFDWIRHFDSDQFDYVRRTAALVAHPAAQEFDWSRHQVASAGNFVAGSYDDTRHQVAGISDAVGHEIAGLGDGLGSLLSHVPGLSPAGHFMASSFDTSRHEAASAGDDVASVIHSIGSFLGFGSSGSSAKAAPAPAPKQWASVLGSQGAASSKIAGPDTSGVDKATADTLRDASQIEHAFKIGKPPAIPAPDMSQLAGAKGKAMADATGITSAITDALHKPAKAAAPDLSAYSEAASAARSDGEHVSAGLAAGITAGGPQAIAAAHAVAAGVEAAMAAALKTQSPSKVTETIGKDTAAGLVVGLEGGQSAVNAAATALGKNVAKAADIASIDSEVTKLKAYLPGDTGLTKMLTADQAKLTTLANKRAKLETEITDSQQIAQSAISNASILNAGSYTSALSANGPQDSSATIQGMQAMAADQKQFAAQIGQLQKEGLNSTSVNQLVQGGAASGLPVTAGLVGNKSAIAQINQLEAQIKSSAAKLGDEAAPSMYQAGVQAGQGLASGIESQLGTVDAAIKDMAQSMVNTMKSALKSKSPSQVFAEIGMSAPQGAAMGVDQGAHLATAAVGRMGSAMTAAGRGGDGSSHPGLTYGHAGGYGGGHGGGGSTTIIYHTDVHMVVQGSVAAQNDLVSAVRKGIRKTANNNWQAGVIPPGRGG